MKYELYAILFLSNLQVKPTYCYTCVGVHTFQLLIVTIIVY